MSSTLHHKEDRSSRTVGVVVTIAIHCILLYLLIDTFFIPTAPSSSTLFIELDLSSEDPARAVLQQDFKLPEIEEEAKFARPEDKTASGAKPSLVKPPAPTAKSAIDKTGDVEAPSKSLYASDERSLFQSDDKGTVTATAVGERDARTLYRGSSEGQDISHSSDDVSSFSLSGRTVLGKLSQPVNTTNKEGRVMVDITVDQQGRVIKAKARARGSSVQDVVLWKAAETAAKETLFNLDQRAPVLQVGTITYIFKLI